MKLSVIIVNYNVRHFLEQCLHSVFQASQQLEAEVIVVDNNSVDGSVSMLKEKFPSVILIENKDNLGFSRANNQAIRVAGGQYMLLLNPDTIVEKDTFTSTLQFLDAHPEAGALGVKMIDGAGRFLPESKRGLPTPAVAFYKIFGLTRLFPRSKMFGAYHLGYLSPDEIHQVEVLSGAFMMIRAEALEKTGLLDESFFMYGEDIDLSYRLIMAGYRNYYFPGTRIIHYKGESTRKSSVNYVFTFYRAMAIFARKHFSQSNARVFSLLINLAIYLRALAALFSRFSRRAFLPLADALMLFGGIMLIKGWWEQMLFPWGGHYPGEFTRIAVPAYIFLWLGGIYLSGGYDRPVRNLRILQGYALGTLVILVFYSLLDESYRFSRAMIFFGLLWGLFASILLRLILHFGIRSKYYRLGGESNKRFLILGQEAEALRVAGLVRQALLHPGFIGLVAPGEKIPANQAYIGNIRQLREIIAIYGIEEVIFCSRDLPAADIIDLMSEHRDLEVEFKIAPPESLSIIGSKKINTAEDLYIIEIDGINKNENKRLKILLDLAFSCLLLLTLPLILFIVRRPAGLLANLWGVFTLRISWVGYAGIGNALSQHLPGIRKGVLSPRDLPGNIPADNETINRLNLLYSRDYKITTDLSILLGNLRELGRKV